MQGDLDETLFYDALLGVRSKEKYFSRKVHGNHFVMAESDVLVPF